MELIIWVIVLLLGCAQAMLQQATVLRLVKTSYPTHKLFISATLIIAASSFLNRSVFMLDFIPLIIYIGMTILSYRLVFQQSFLVSVLMGAGQIVLASCVDYLAYILLVPMNDFVQKSYNLGVIIARVIGLSILYVVFLAVRKYKIQFNYHNVKTERRYLWVSYFFYLLMFSIPNALNSHNQRLLTSSLDIYNAVLLVVFFVYNIMYVRSIIKAAEVTYELEAQRLYSKTLEASLEDLRGFKHDFANILCVVAGYINDEDYASAQSVSESLMKKFLKINTSDIVNTQLKEIPHLYVMMLSKLHRAETTNIDFSVTVKDKLCLDYCEPLDFSRVVGNLLDNALEAAAESEAKLVNLDIFVRDGQNHITIQNSYAGDIDISTIVKSECTTKKGHTGLGLRQIRLIVEKYRSQGYAMELRAICEKGTFTQTFIV